MVETGVVVGLLAQSVSRWWRRAARLPCSRWTSFGIPRSVRLGAIVSLTIFGLVFLMSLYFQQVLFYSPSETGLAFVPFGLITIATNIAAGRVAARMGVRPVIVVGLLVAAAGYWSLRGIDETTTYVSMLPGQLMIRVGVALTAPSVMTATLMCVDRARSGIASGVLNTVRETGSAFGVAMFGALIADSTVAGIQAAIILSGLLLASGIAMIGIRHRPERRSS